MQCTEFWCLQDVDELEVTEDPILDIDGRDLKNPLAVVEYVDDIYAYYRKIEVSFLRQQLKMKSILLILVTEMHIGQLRASLRMDLAPSNKNCSVLVIEKSYL